MKEAKIDKGSAVAGVPVFTIKGKGWSAQGQVRDDGFVVFAGSTVNEISDSLEKHGRSYYMSRMKCESDEIISDGAFVRDFIFKSAAEAASVVSGRLANVNNQLKSDDGRTFGECYPKQHGKKKRELVTKVNKVADDAPMGDSVMDDGTPRFVKAEGGMVIEVRGGGLVSQSKMAAMM